MIKPGLYLIALTLCLFGTPATAHEKGDFILRGGIINVDPRGSENTIDVAGLTTLPGVDVDSDTQLGITGTYMLTNRIGLEVLAATPFKHDIYVAGVGIKAGSAKQLPPTISIQYYFGDTTSQFRPYVGLGINTTIFFEEEVDAQLNSALDGIAGVAPGTVNADLELDQSWGLAAQVGFDYMLNDRWLINGAIWYADIDTDATIHTAIADVPFDVEIDPLVYLLSIGYKF